MSKIGLIVSREFNQRVRKKSFILTTILTPLLLVGLMVAPALVMQLRSDQVKRIACMSDGFSQILEYPGHQDITALLDRIEHDYLKTAEELYALQEADADCQVVPRLKKRDDATLTFARIATN